jgi:GTPase
MSFTVAIVGRPNVGKSTLFNRLIGKRLALTDDLPGVTRDRRSGEASLGDLRFTVIDTAGLEDSAAQSLTGRMRRQTEQAVVGADVALFLIDARAGLTPLDRHFAHWLRKQDTPVVLVANKCEGRLPTASLGEAFALGLGEPIPVSAEHGEGLADLYDAIKEHAPEAPGEAPAAAAEGPLQLAIVGRPNVGKSSLLNRLLREERAIVSDMPGTTRDTVDAVLRWHKRKFRILDTAGIRRPGRVARSGQVESVSVIVARRAIEEADVAVLVVDASEGATDQDAAIAGEADKAGCGIIIAANKWDLMKARGPEYVKEFDEKLRMQLKFLDYAPVLHISALTGERAPKLIEMIDKVSESRTRRIPTAELNRFVQAVTAVHPPASPGRREVRILYAAQTGVAPPTFVFFTNVATSFHFSYERFLVNRLRESFGLLGTPVRIQVRRREK